jgi:hypothetical protein
MIKAAITVTWRVDRPRFPKPAKVIESYESPLVKNLGFTIQHLNLTAHEGEVEVLIHSDRVAVKAPPPAIPAGPSIIPDVDATAVDRHFRIERTVI